MVTGQVKEIGLDELKKRMTAPQVRGTQKPVEEIETEILSVVAMYERR